MLSPDTLSTLKYVLLTVTAVIFGGCLSKIIFNPKDIEKSANVVSLSMVSSLCIMIMTLESYEARIVASYAVLVSTVYILAKDIRKNSK